MSTAVEVQDRRGSIAGSDTQAMRRVGLVRPTSNPAEVMEAHKAIAEMVSKVLEDGIDFGEIPGTEGKKALLKAGAERLAFSIGASLELEIMEKEVDHQLLVDWTKRQKDWYNEKGKRKWKWAETHGTSRGLYRYVVKCRLVRREDGAVLGEGIGSCSTMESKYVDRPRDMENTVLKMAKKRAAVDAVLSTMALTGRFAPEEAADEADNQDDGVVADPTDGLTLAIALAHVQNGAVLGEMRPKTLSASRAWCDGKLQDDFESPPLLRLSAMLDMVIEYRKANPVETKAAQSPTAAAAPAAAAVTNAALEADDDEIKLPF